MSQPSSKTIYHFGISGGKDSTALLLWATYESGIPLEQIKATFCDTGNENDFTLAYVRMLNDFIFPIETIRADKQFYELAKHKGMFPAKTKRWCTQELKMKPTQAWLNQFECEVILHSGVRASESNERSKMPSEEFDNFFARVVRRPLLGYTLEDVWAIHDRYSVPRNPLYDMGAGRIGCWPCFMARKAELRVIADKDPDRMVFLANEEATFPDGQYHSFFPRDKIPLCQRTKDFVAASGERMKVAGADDIVRWSRTVRGGKQYALGTIDEDAFEQEDDKTISCPSAIGQCE